MIKWDESQKAVIEAAFNHRIIVEAGPGSGKTAVACAKVAYLIDHYKINPSKIWLLSFTRTAVKEITDRIMSYVKVKENALSVKISTIDSQVFAMLRGFDDAELKKLFDSYELNIDRFIKMLEEQNDNLLDYLEEIQHVIIDEAQDITGNRKELICGLIKSLDRDCGITVFADEAQAIYGFTNDLDELANDDGRLLTNEILGSSYGSFFKRSLDGLHRTSDENLVKIVKDVRKTVLDSSLPPLEKLNQIKKTISDLAHEKLPTKPDNKRLLDKRDTLILYRTRFEVLKASAYLWGDKIPHKIRTSGLSPRLHPTLARIFSGFYEDKISFEKFLRLWMENISIFNLYNDDIALDFWESFKKNCGEENNKIVVKKIRELLARSRPPVEFLVKEDELPGPILGTIHASKGRESEFVQLMLPTVRNFGNNNAESIHEEARVVYVGATRAKAMLNIGKSNGNYARRLEGSKRIFRKTRTGNLAQFEIGLEGDVDIYSQVVPMENRSDEHIHTIQDYLWKNGLEHVELHATNGDHTQYKFWLHERKVQFISGLTKNFNNDIWKIGEIILQRKNVKPADRIMHIHMFGCRTVVLKEDDPNLINFAYPYKHTGFFLVPCITAFTTINYRYFNRR